MQPRFEKRTGNTPFSLVEQPRFRAAFDFMRLRADVGEVDVVLADWWQEFSQASDQVREDLVAQLRDELQKNQRRVRSARPKPAREPREDERDPRELPAASPAEPVEAGSAEGDGAAGDAPRKRRRRRRKPAGQGAGGGEGQPPSAGETGD